MLQQSDVQRIPSPERGNITRFDDGPKAVKGFGVRVTAAGTRSFILDYRIDGRQRRYTIGQHPAWKVAAARERAKELKRGIETGVDPLARRKHARAAPTVNDLADRYVEDYLPRKRESSQEADKGMLAQYIRPVLGSRKVAEITLADVEALHRDISTGKRTRGGLPRPIRANRVVAVLSKMFTLATRWGMITVNPCRGVEKNAENKRRRYFSQREIVAIGEALDSYPAPIAADCVRLIMLTGCRPGEARLATWDQFDLQRGVWTKPGATTKQKSEHRAPIGAPALALLQRMRKERPTGEVVFHGRRKDQPLTQLHSVWGYVCKKAKLADARAHDLRHTYASILASGGLSLPIIGALLGHTQPATTARYAHLHDEPLREAADVVGRYITAAGQGKTADVVPLKGGA